MVFEHVLLCGPSKNYNAVIIPLSNIHKCRSLHNNLKIEIYTVF